MTHELKIRPEYFLAVFCGSKRFELRKDDRGYKVGDYLLFKEFKDGAYTGRTLMPHGPIRYILRNCPEYGLKEGYCIIGW